MTVRHANPSGKKGAKATGKAGAKALSAGGQQQKAHPAAAASAQAPHGAARGLHATGATADPPGNNGTVKIASLGDLDRIPNNTAHPGCSFEVQWYGYDRGADVVSTVSFTSQAPTGDVTITAEGPARVPVGQDAASGAGTASGLDAIETYTLSFAGGAPAKQGYHVRLTVATPRSLGNDTKSKVFWVEPCASAMPASVVGPPRAAVPDANPVPAVTATPNAVVVPPLPGRSTASPTPTPGVPTAIDAGQHHSLAARVATSPWAWALLALGLAAMVTGITVGARRRA